MGPDVRREAFGEVPPLPAAKLHRPGLGMGSGSRPGASSCVLTWSWSRTDVPALLTRCALPFVPLSIFKFVTRATLALFSTPAMCVPLTHRLPVHRPPDSTSQTITLQMVFLVLVADLPNHLSFQVFL